LGGRGTRRGRRWHGAVGRPIAAGLLLAGASGAGPNLAVESVEPTPNRVDAPLRAVVAVHLDRPADPATVTAANVRVFGRWSGAAAGALALADGDTTILFTPADPFSAGETVTVTLARHLAGADGTTLRPAGYAWQFWTVAAPAAAPTFTRTATMTTRTLPGVSSRAYGGIGSDLDGDGFLDLTIVNEDTADLRVFMNLADGTGAYAPFLQPTFPVGDRASPSEPADFDHDGHTDVCVANIDDATVSILLGRGDGTFAPQQLVPVGVAPRGIAVLDADGDGDPDIVNTNSGSSNLSLLLNDGSGVFGAPTFLEGGLAGEWSLAAADMNGDGVLDLVVGGRVAEQVNVLIGRGGGVFVPLTPQLAGGETWMIALGDVDGDGDVDVSTANSNDNVGAILRGDGAGGLHAPQTYATDPFPLATDLGDVDGDGDLDWVTSSFAGDFFLFLNDGSGVFAFHHEFPAPLAASCALLLDIDNDLDLDLALVDELADEVMIERNTGPVFTGDANGDGVVDVTDLLLVLGEWGSCPGCDGDLDLSGVVDVTDLLLVLARWSP
jgi:hypothetical protein